MLTPPEWRDLDARNIAELELIGTLAPFEKEYLRKDGSRVSVLIGGAMCFSFFRAQGLATGNSLVEVEDVEPARRVLLKAEGSNCRLVLPVDLVVAESFDAAAPRGCRRGQRSQDPGRNLAGRGRACADHGNAARAGREQVEGRARAGDQSQDAVQPTPRLRRRRLRDARRRSG